MIMQYIKCKFDGNNEFMHHVRQVNTANFVRKTRGISDDSL